MVGRILHVKSSKINTFATLSDLKTEWQQEGSLAAEAMLLQSNESLRNATQGNYMTPRAAQIIPLGL